LTPVSKFARAGILPLVGGQLVLAGDPMQLGPIVRSPISSKFGLKESILERLMKREVYLPGKKHFP
jgi:putative helicase MOV10L1